MRRGYGFDGILSRGTGGPAVRDITLGQLLEQAATVGA